MKFDTAYSLSLDEKLSIYDVRDLNFDETADFDSDKDRFGNNWLTWYSMENGFGAKAMKAKAAHMPREKTIRTIADLADLLGFMEPGKATR